MTTHTTKAAAWLGSLIAAACVLPTTAGAQDYCGQTSLQDCLEGGTIGYATPATVSGVETIARLRDSDGDGEITASDASWALYRKLLGPRYTMPETPLVRIIFNDLRLGHEIPLVQDFGPTEYDTRYLEFGISLLAQYGPHVGWRDIRLWLNNLAGFETGRGGQIAKFLSEMVYEQNPRRVEGYATSYAGPEGDTFVMRGDWRPAPDAALLMYPDDPTGGRRTSDGTHDGDPWAGSVSLGQFTSLPTAPYNWATGQDIADNPTAPPETLNTVFVRIQINPEFDVFNVSPPARQSLADADPLPDMFDEAAGESWATIIDTDQELVGIQYGPWHTNLVAEGVDITADGPCDQPDTCEGGPYLETTPPHAPSASETSAPVAAAPAPSSGGGGSGSMGWLGLGLMFLGAGVRRARRGLLPMVAAMSVLLPMSASAQEFGEPTEGCTNNQADCRGLFVLPGYVRLFQTFVPIKDTPEARAEYERLLPPGFSMPDNPGFKYTFNDAHVGTEVMEVDRAVAYLGTLAGQAPAGTAWRETGVLITAKYTNADGVTQQGTYEIGFSTDGLVGYLGRPSYPKYYADVTFHSTLPEQVPNAIASLARLVGPGETWTSASFVAGPTTGGESEITQQGTFVPVEGMEMPEYFANFEPLDWRLDATMEDGGGTHQGPIVRQNEVLYAEPVPVSYLIGRSLGPLAVPGVTAPDVRVGMVHLQVDDRFPRFDEQSPEPMPDEVWHDIDLSKMIDLEGTYPGIMVDGQQVLRANPEIIAGRGGCASNGTCREPLQYRPQNDSPSGEPFTNSFLSLGVVDGTACVAYSVNNTLRNRCQFTTNRPDGSPVVGVVSATTGAFELSATNSSCRIWLVQNNGRHFSGSNGIVQSVNGRDTFRANGTGVGLIGLDDRCTYTLDVAANGSGPVYAGQTHGNETPDQFAQADRDGDGIEDGVDNCPDVGNATQVDSNGDGAGDACQARRDAPNLAELPAVDPEGMPGCAPPVAQGGDWPSYGHDLANTRSQPLEHQITQENVGELTTHYVFDAQDHTNTENARDFSGKFFNTPVVADGCLYNAVSGGTVFAANADTGELVWSILIDDDTGYNHLSGSGPTIGSVTVDQVRNRIYVLVTGEGDPNVDDGVQGAGDPYVAALDQATGDVIWRSDSITPQDDLTNPDHDDPLSYFLSSTVLYDDMVIATFGGNAGQPYYRGGLGIVNADTGEVEKITNLFTQEDYDNNMAGGTTWATGVVDQVNKKFFVGTGNPGASTREHKWTNAIIKVELDRASPQFGEIIGSYKGDNDHYVNGTEFIDEDEDNPCFDVAEQGRDTYPANTLPCAQLDLDFGASANLFYAPDGRVLVGEMQKSGTYHVAFADTMELAWKSIIGTPCFPCNAASSAVVDDRVFVVGAPPRTMFGLEDGDYEWLTPITANGIHYQSVSAANGVVYTYDANNLHGFDAESGLPLLRLQLTQDELVATPDQGQIEEVAGGNFSHPATAAVLNSDSSGIAIARNTLYVAGNTRIYALRLASSAGADGDVDGDGVRNSDDNCEVLGNPDQADSDGDGVGDACEGQAAQPDDDADNDGVPNDADQCPGTPAGEAVDADGCAESQTISDRDGDGVADDTDNCPSTANPGQADADGDGIGDACEAPDQGSNAGSFEQGCRTGAEDLPYPEAGVELVCGMGFASFDAAQAAFCAEFEGTEPANMVCPDGDADGAWDGRDNCPTEPNADQTDTDNDGAGDACDDSTVTGGDEDGDGVANNADQCPDTAPGAAVDARGCPAASGTLEVELSADPTTADVTDGPQTVTFTADPTVGDADLSGQLTYVYYFGDGSNSGETTATSVDHDYDAAGEYTATVVVHDENGNAASDSVAVTMTTTVTVGGEPGAVMAVLSIATNGTTAPVTATLDASGSQNKPDGAVYRFDFGDGSTRQTTNPTVTHVYSLPGDYAVSVTVTDPADADNRSTATGQVTVNAAQQTTAIVSVSPSQATVNETAVQFDASGSIAAPGEQITSYTYDYYGDGSVVETKAEATSSFVYTRTGEFQPTVTVNDSAQGSSQAKAQVAVSPVGAADTPASGSSGGGSGSLGWLMLVGLGAAAWRRRRA